MALKLLNKNKPVLALAPMAGITDQPFRLICKSFGVDLLYSEMISSEAIFHKKQLSAISRQLSAKNEEEIQKTLELIRFSKKESPFLAQIFGSDIEHMTFAAKYIATGEWIKDYKKLSAISFQPSAGLEIENWKLKIASIPAGIDVNMGCPAKDIVKQGAGSALMKNPKLAADIIKSIKKNINIPLTIKTRLGWSDPKEIFDFAKMVEDSGADLIAIHGRTYKQGFSGKANWETIYKVKKNLSIPVILNGGVNTESCKLIADSSKIDGIMVGQGALGRPWIFQEIKNKSLLNPYHLLLATVLEHAKLTQKLKGERGIIEFRKHLGWYFKGLPEASAIRSKLSQINSLEDIKKLLKNLNN